LPYTNGDKEECVSHGYLPFASMTSVLTMKQNLTVELGAKGSSLLGLSAAFIHVGRRVGGTGHESTPARTPVI
jgi:hypothetical protein